MGDKQKAYIFSQKEGENDTRKPVLVEITKNEISEIKINGFIMAEVQQCEKVNEPFPIA